MPLRSADLVEAHRCYASDAKKVKPEALRQYVRWQRLTLAFLREEYGDSLRSAVLHYDEEFVHMHFYAANQLVGGTLNLDGLDVAADAERSLQMDRATRNKSGAERKSIRSRALKHFQDRYFDLVAGPLGWSRLGPKNPRMTRQQYGREKKAGKQLAAITDDAGKLVKEVERLEASLLAARKMYHEAVEGILPALRKLDSEVQFLKYQPDASRLAEVSQEARKLVNRLTPKV